MNRIAALMLLVFGVNALADGPTILYEEDPSLLTSTIQVVILTGSTDDPKGKRGLSNLLGEITLRGTRKRDRNQFQKEVESLGATIQVQTADDMTAYVGKVIKENTDAFFKLMSETIFEPKFSPKEFKALQTEVLADISHAKNQNSRLAGLALRREILEGSSLEVPGIGTTSSVKKVSLKDVVAQYKASFVRPNFVFAISSPYKKEKFEKLITPFWKKFPDGKKIERGTVPFKMPEGPKLVLVHKPKTETGTIVFGQPGITVRDDARFALGTGNFSFGGEPLVSRLFRTIRSELGWTYAIGTTYNAMGQLNDQQGLFVISTTPSVEFSSKTLFKVMEMWKEYLKAGLKKDELSLAHESLVNSYPFTFDSAQKRLWQKLRAHVYGVPVLSPEDYSEKIRDIDNGDLKKSLKSRHDPNSWIIAVTADKTVFEKQLMEAQKDVPAAKRLTISKVYTPEQLVN